MKNYPCLLLFCLLVAAPVCRAADEETPAFPAIEQLYQELAANPELRVETIATLPDNILGPIEIVKQYDLEKDTWVPLVKVEKYGEITPGAVIFMDYRFGESGFVRAEHLQAKDRLFVSYTGITPDRKVALTVVDDEAVKETLTINIRIGTKKISYLMRRPK